MLPEPLVDLCRADQYERQKAFWQELTQQWRADVAASLKLVRAEVERLTIANQRLRDDIRRVVRAAGDPRSLSVADVEVLKLQWADAADPVQVGARDWTERRWRCTVEPRHGTWMAPPKDRSRGDRPSMCWKCSGAAPRPGEWPALERSVAAIPALAAEVHPASGAPEAISYGSNKPVTWWHQVPAVRPGTGEWYWAIHTWQQPPKSRTGLRYKNGQPAGINGCPVCNSDQADASNSLATWYPELAEQWGRGPAGRTAHNTPVGSKIEVKWRCIASPGSHEEWPAPPNRRTAKVLRSGCPACSKNISAKALALFHELRTHLPDLELEAPILLPPVPGKRYRGERVDMWDEALRLVVEFDGWKAHGPESWRDRSTDDRLKTQRLTAAGHTVIRVREDLDPVGEHDVVVGSGWSAWKVTAAVLRRVQQLGLHPLPDLATYLERGTETAAADVEKALLGMPYEPRRFPKQRKPSAGHRKLKATEPHPDSWLTPVGSPYPNPKKRAGSLRDYRCKCGTVVTRLRQVDVTRGNTKSCGSHRDTSPAVATVRVDRKVTQAARQWALQRGIEVKVSGALDARVLASYIVYAADMTQFLGANSLIPENAVSAWADEQQILLGARGRLPRSVWLGYATSVLAPPGKNRRVRTWVGQLA
ncbi:zinc-ribbon domain-containing protein [Streptomyces pseudovenezuelae]|uniref:zinc-ribbon domain-containing protein n=1 Tax=Streptomyces pseudovenezuelae TaxID=67350 RepID=UPI0036EEF53B